MSSHWCHGVLEVRYIFQNKGGACGVGHNVLCPVSQCGFSEQAYLEPQQQWEVKGLVGQKRCAAPCCSLRIFKQSVVECPMPEAMCSTMGSSQLCEYSSREGGSSATCGTMSSILGQGIT